MKRLQHIAGYLVFYREVFLDPHLQSLTLRENIQSEYGKTAHQLRTLIRGIKQAHHHDIQSLPSGKFIEIIRAIFVRPVELFLNESGKPSRNLLRDRAMSLLACEGLRPGTIGNIARADFRHDSRHLVIKDNREKRGRTTTSTPKLKLGASTQVNSASETMIELWPFTVEAIRQYGGQVTERSPVLDRLFASEARERLERLHDALAALPLDAYALKIEAGELAQQAEHLELYGIVHLCRQLLQTIPGEGQIDDLESATLRQSLLTVLHQLETAIVAVDA